MLGPAHPDEMMKKQRHTLLHLRLVIPICRKRLGVKIVLAVERSIVLARCKWRAVIRAEMVGDLTRALALPELPAVQI
jgi:hypothetical protein